MTRVNALVLDGSEVKLRLEAERLAHKTPVHVDWVRFTCLVRNAPLPAADSLFPLPVANVWDAQHRCQEWAKVLKEIPDVDFLPSTQALELAREVCSALGDGFDVHPEVRKGHDFYRFRWSIERNGEECGWVGFLASGDSPRQQAQASTIHANLYGHACTFAANGWTDRLADLIDDFGGKITRADLALDFFDGLPGGATMRDLEKDYHAGAFDVAGKRPKVSNAGDWWNGSERSLYIGSREAGKQTNIYEKGDQLFGVAARNPWVRAELRYGNKLRVLPSDILRRPADFFAGASDWHAAALRSCDVDVCASACPQVGRLAAESVKAEVSRNVRWAISTAAPTFSGLIEFLGVDQLAALFTNIKRPGRLRRFSQGELASAFDAVVGSFSSVGGAGLVPA